MGVQWLIHINCKFAKLMWTWTMGITDTGMFLSLRRFCKQRLAFETEMSKLYGHNLEAKGKFDTVDCKTE